MDKKKRRRIIILVILLIISMIPIRFWMTDGGNTGLFAILWQYTDYHQLTHYNEEICYRVGPCFTILGFLTIYDGTYLTTMDGVYLAPYPGH